MVCTGRSSWGWSELVFGNCCPHTASRPGQAEEDEKKTRQSNALASPLDLSHYSGVTFKSSLIFSFHQLADILLSSSCKYHSSSPPPGILVSIFLHQAQFTFSLCFMVSGVPVPVTVNIGKSVFLGVAMSVWFTTHLHNIGASSRMPFLRWVDRFHKSISRPRSAKPYPSLF